MSININSTLNKNKRFVNLYYIDVYIKYVYRVYMHMQCNQNYALFISYTIINIYSIYNIKHR